MSFRLLIILSLFQIAFQITAQKEGDKWVIGYYSNGSPRFSMMHLDFRGPSLNIELHIDEDMMMNETTANICDLDGEPILWTNGMAIYGKHGVHVTDTLAFDGDPLGYWYSYYSHFDGPFGFPEHDGALILPVPGSEGEYLVIYHSSEVHPDYYFQVTKYLEARVKMNPDSTFIVLYKDVLIGPYLKWYTGPIIASRHANGRDWWIITFEADSPKYFSHLLDPKGIRLDHEGLVDITVEEGLGQAVFSSQGNYMARVDATTFEEGQYITLFSFDRCRGDFIHIGTFHTDAGYFTGAAFSPSERYLYADDNTHLWQWDLLAENIAASQTLVDTFDGFVQPGWFQMQFGPMMTAPDGRIYIVPPAGSSNYLHVIDRPDLPASECRFRQHYIDLNVSNGRSAPNIPNFRLGPADGSSCDTLGLDNLPIARWRYEDDQPGLFHIIRFTDLSFYDPEVWLWDFDDGSTSSDRSPVHTFESGLYHVCLTVSNENASDISCQWIEILETGTKDGDVNGVPDLSISPNPFHDKLIIHSVSGTFRSAYVQLFDMYGRNVFDQAEVPVPVSLVIPSLSPGMYLCMIKDQDGTIYSFKVMKI